MYEILPIGSVVETNDSKILMIIGYGPNKYNESLIYEYICCKPKSGINKNIDKLILNKDYFFINNTDINIVRFIGYYDNNFSIFSNVFNEFILSIKNFKQNNNNDISEEDIMTIINNIKQSYQDLIGSDE